MLLGMVSQLGKFSKRIAELSSPLRELLSRGVPIITSASISVVDMLIFPISVIGTKGLGSQYKYQYNSNKIIFYLVHK